MKRLHLSSAIFAGVIGTAAMTLMMMVAPLMGMPKMDVAAMLSGFMQMPILMGWMAHFMIGIVLAFGYALIFVPRVELRPILNGAVYGLIPWLMAQVIVMPMMGAPLFSGSFVMSMGSLVGHLIFGGVVGAIYRPLSDNPE